MVATTDIHSGAGLADQEEAEPIALIDLDSTIADFDRAMRAELDKLASPDDPRPHDLPKRSWPAWYEARRALIKKLPGFWQGLPRIRAGFEVVDLLRYLKFSLNILTKGPARSTIAWTEKAEWCKVNIPDAAITITQDKGLVYGRVLVDDWPPYIMRWLEWRPRGLVIMLDWPHNRQVYNEDGGLVDFEHPNVFRYEQALHGATFDEQQKRLKDRLIAARDR